MGELTKDGMSMATTIATKAQTFVWRGKNRNGKKQKGEIVARSPAMARAELRNKGIIANKLRKKTAPLFSQSKRITAKDITIFTRQMATMLIAGIPLVQAFDIVSKGLTNPKMQSLVFEIKTKIEGGATFAESIDGYPKYFNRLYCSLVDAGENSGSLDIMLDKIATYKEKIESLKGKIKKALFYPSAVIAVAILVTAALLIFVVPQFEKLFKGFGADLPALTQLILDLSAFFQQYWWIIFAAMAGTVILFFKAVRRYEKLARLIDRIVLKLPILGSILQKSAIARFSRTLAITFAAGVPLVDALKTVAGSTGNFVYYDATMAIRDQVTNGQQMHQSMQEVNCFPSMVVQMVAIGEESGSLETMLTKVADFHEEEVDNAVDSLSSLLEPLIMVILGGLVGTLVIAMYLPIFKIGSVI